MQIFPAIDLRGGYCVRLRQGDYAQETIFDNDPVAVAKRWEAQGAAGLHLVDLDGAKQGEPVNAECIRKIRAAVHIPCQVGGGLRDDSHIEKVLSWGVDRVILGTRALQDPLWLRSVCERHPEKVVLGLDSRAGRVATHGWVETSPQSVIEVARRAASWPLAAIVYTDILRDGMLEGPNFAGLAELRSAVQTPVLASGGITTLDDIRALKALDLAGCVIGRSLYEGLLDLTEVVKVVQSK
jgi:phosphoribosylformimino-5-aminoimidazole carboxamide ribotide isomerase